MDETIFDESFDGEESFYAIVATKKLIQIFSLVFQGNISPLWIIIEHFALQTFGVGETTVRAVSFGFYLITVFLVYKISRLLFSRKTATISTLFTALNPVLFVHSFEGKQYSLLAAGVSGSMYFFIKTFFDQGDAKTRLGYIISTLVALYSHQFAVFIFLPQWFWWLYEVVFGRRKSALRFLKVFIHTAILYAPLLYIYTKSHFTTATAVNPSNLIHDVLLGIKTLPTKAIPIPTNFYLNLLLYLNFSILVMRKWWRAKRKTALLALWALMPTLAAIWATQKFQIAISARDLIYSIPPAMIILASARSRLSFIPITILLILFGATNYIRFYNPEKPPFKEFSETIKQKIEINDYLVNWQDEHHYLWESRFYNINAPIYLTGNLQEFSSAERIVILEDRYFVDKIPNDSKRLGVITHQSSVEKVYIPDYTIDKIESADPLKLIWLTKNRP
jgi:4-amino-4-deoxy-L-arabinose transferase-like glycosyltransferase